MQYCAYNADLSFQALQQEAAAAAMADTVTRYGLPSGSFRCGQVTAADGFMYYRVKLCNS